MSHEEVSQVLGAYALDAVDGDEYADLENHLAVCPHCQSELDSLREVAGAVGNSVEPLPEGLWASIAIRLPDAPQDSEPPPMPRLESATRLPFRAPSSGRTQRTRKALVLVGAVAVAGIAVALVFAISLVRSQDNVARLQDNVWRLQNNISKLDENADATPAEIAMQTPGHVVVSLGTSSGEQLATFVIVPGGQGYLASSVLPKLAPATPGTPPTTYQLWGKSGGTWISLGLLGASPMVAQFSVADAPSVSELAVSVEQAGGSVTPDLNRIVASGNV
jgi:anti-sigma-K factor RskA